MTAPTAHDVETLRNNIIDCASRMYMGIGSRRRKPYTMDFSEVSASAYRMERVIATLEATIARLTAPIAEDLLREVVERNAEVIRKYVPCTCDREHMEPWHQQGCLRYFNDCITTALNQHAEERRRLVAERDAARHRLCERCAVCSELDRDITRCEIADLPEYATKEATR